MNEDDLATTVSSFELPASSFLSEETKRELAAQKIGLKRQLEEMADSRLSFDLLNASKADMPALREAMINMLTSSLTYISMQNRYSTTMREEVLNGVLTEVFTPNEGIAKRNSERVLVNLHAGSFMGGERSGSHLESIPIAAVGKIKVVSVDYRMAPEYQFPAASDDVLKVYNCLLKEYAQENIGIYGSSAGALLTSQVVARIEHERLPRPAAFVLLAMVLAYFIPLNERRTKIVRRRLMG